MSPLEDRSTDPDLTAVPHTVEPKLHQPKKTVRSLRHDRTGSSTMLPWSRRRSRLSGSLETLEDVLSLTHPADRPALLIDAHDPEDRPEMTSNLPVNPAFSQGFRRIPEIAGFSRKNPPFSRLFAATWPRQASIADTQGLFLTSDYGPFLYRLSSSSELGSIPSPNDDPSTLSSPVGIGQRLRDTFSEENANR